jgi:hypothetical protein
MAAASSPGRGWPAVEKAPYVVVAAVASCRGSQQRAARVESDEKMGRVKSTPGFHESNHGSMAREVRDRFPRGLCLDSVREMLQPCTLSDTLPFRALYCWLAEGGR